MANNAMTEISDLDDFDRRILNIVQCDNQRTHADIGEAVGLSASAVRRRLKLLRDTGFIEKDVALLRASNIGVRLIVLIYFQNESIEAFNALDEQIRTTPEILQGYHVSGSMDYVLIVQGPDVEWYEEWGKQAFMSNPAIRRYDSHVVWSCKKFDTALPL
ncbi:Lrp/AsnC family transcriptional regulator [Parasphingorhabdus litoris]|uniref:Lrp/AsnC family transcriptional regulator n=1 Tax=Parasphingorhabdus litoris TaxID=394733 RepID=A0ABN1AHZ2_9SPHN|nr:Lrp/AsnC family transcriptional regulator [Parasphingorhabdus litoris]